MRLTFKGGVHPFEGKEMSKDCPVEKYLPKADLAYPLSQHIGAPAKPVVAKGDHVLAGQMIAEAGGFVSAPVHASVSGTVKGIEKRLTATGSMVDSIIVENDGLYEEVEFHPADPASLTREAVSYTHLDVYKRQGNRCRTGRWKFYGGRPCSGCHWRTFLSVNRLHRGWLSLCRGNRP